ncbi:MAG: DNRLRE domain-containing protein, partial [Anaerolineales bacterium]|nr:DNRLRE domain-containing protein [Anaerolineales bacterium]
EVSLAVVDEAIFSLSEELSDSMIDAFYGRRLNAVRTYNSMAPFRWIWTPGRGGGGGGEEGWPPHDLRSDFLDTAIWLPVLRTNSSGETVATFTLPDNLTTWRMTAKAFTRDTKVGETTTDIITHQDLVVKPLLPRRLILGDRMMLSTLVHNYTDRGRWIDVSLETTNLVIEGDAVQQVFVEADEILVVGWEVHAEQTGQAQVIVMADAGDIRDAVQLSFPISPLAIADVFSESGRVEHEFEMDFDIPGDAIKESSLTIELSRSIDGNLLSGLEYLTGFPYGCVEQIMSKALPNAVVGRALNIVDAGVPYLPYDLSKKINLGLQMLYAKQHQDGGWGWWYDDDSHDYQTAWVVFGLAMTSEAGYEVDQKVIQRGVEWLYAHFSQMDPRTEAFALYSMSLAGYGNLEETISEMESGYAFDTFSIAAMALTLEELGETGKAQELLKLLQASAQQVGSKVFWDLPHSDGYYKSKTMASSIRSTALALSAFVRIDPDHELIPGIVRWLMEKRQPLGWGTTNETSFAVLGLTDYIESAVLVIDGSGYTVELNGQEIARGSVNIDQPLVKIEVEYDQMVPGENTLRILRSGDGKLYFVVVGKTYMAQEAIMADGEIEISRTYFNADSNQRVEHVEAGSLVKVELLVHMPDVGHYMIIEDYLPGGLEALNEGLNTASRWLGEANTVEPDYRWESLGYNNKEVYGNRVSFFVTEMSKGRHKFTYFARAVNSGTFVALPTQAWGMYDLAFWGRSASNSIEIIDDRFVPKGKSDVEGARSNANGTLVLEAFADTYVRTDWDIRRNDNYGCQDFMVVGSGRGGDGKPFGAPDAMRAMVRFDLSSIPQKPLESAFLEMTIHSFDQGESTSAYTVEVYSILRRANEPHWEEGDGTEATSIREGCYWVDEAGGVAWDGHGDGGDKNNQTMPDFDLDPPANVSIYQSATEAGDSVSWDITSLVQDWISGKRPNYGVMLRDVTSAGSFRGVRFVSKEGESIYNLRGWQGPRLILNFED